MRAETEAIHVAQFLLRRKQGKSVKMPWADRQVVEAASRLDPNEITELRVLRDPDALYEEFVARREGEPSGVAALLYAATKFPDHPHAAEMLNCCALNRVYSAGRVGHLSQALAAFEMAISLAPFTELSDLRWKAKVNRLWLLNIIGAVTRVYREAGAVLVELPADHGLVPAVCSNLGHAAHRLGRYQVGVHAYERALSVRPYDRYRMGLAACLISAGDIEVGAQIVAALVEDTPYRLAVQAQLHLARGEWRETITVAEEAIRRMPPQTPWTLDRAGAAYIHRYAAAAHERLGNGQAAYQHRRLAEIIGGILLRKGDACE